VPSQKSGGASPKINSNIENIPPETTYDLSFRVWGSLKMQAAHGAFLAGKRVVDLGDRFGKPRLPEFISAEETGEETATVLNGPTLHDYQAAQVG